MGVPLLVVGLAFSTAGTQGARMRCLDGPVRARFPHECTKQTLAGLRPRGTGGPGRGYERCRVARPEHLNLWRAGRTSRRLFDFDPERAALGTLMTSSKLVDCNRGTGLIGSKTVAILRQRGHEVVAANTGVNTITGEGLKEALTGAVGGRIDGNYSRNLASNEAYDPATKSWEQRAPSRVDTLQLHTMRLWF
jgi:hypothetical protein